MTNYSNGRAREYEVRDLLTGNGYQVMRTAGSHTPIDLIAFKHGEPILCVQVKAPGRGTIPPEDRTKLVYWADGANGIPLVATRPAPRKPWEYRRLTGPGPKDWVAWTPDWAVTP